ncbi:hypothetical protein Agub_g6682, partial [Astrephomene gubernaculifera]
WEELLAVASAVNGSDFNGDGKPDYSICWQVEDCLESSAVMVQVLAPLVQSMGTAHGWLFDPWDMQLLVNSTAMKRALELFQGLQSVTYPGPRCNLAHMEFVMGACAFTVKWSEQFKVTDYYVKALRGRVGVAQLPGSTHVLDRTTGQLVPCTASICPFARTEQDARTGQAVLVNRAPHFGFGSFSGAARRSADAGYQQAVYRFFANLASRDLSWTFVLDPSSPVGPFRYSHVDTANIHRWVEAGYDGNDTVEFLAAWKESLVNPNLALDIRILDSFKYRSILGDAATNISRNLSTPLDELFTAVVHQMALVLAESGGVDKVRAAYRTALGYSSSTPPPPPELFIAHPPPAPAPPPPASSSGPSTLGAVAGGTVAAVVAVVGLLSLAGYWLWARSQGRGLLGSTLPPKPGPETTLLVACLPDLPLLMRELPEPLVARALSQYLAFMRRLLKQHKGYEALAAPAAIQQAAAGGDSGGLGEPVFAAGGTARASSTLGLTALHGGGGGGGTSGGGSGEEADENFGPTRQVSSVPVIGAAAAAAAAVAATEAAVDAAVTSAAASEMAAVATAPLAPNSAFRLGELAGEGWFMVCAFSTARDAVRFAAAAQQGLMRLDWPSLLLEHPACMPLYALSAAVLSNHPTRLHSTQPYGNTSGGGGDGVGRVSEPSPGPPHAKLSIASPAYYNNSSHHNPSNPSMHSLIPHGTYHDRGGPGGGGSGGGGGGSVAAATCAGVDGSSVHSVHAVHHVVHTVHAGAAAVSCSRPSGAAPVGDPHLPPARPKPERGTSAIVRSLLARRHRVLDLFHTAGSRGGSEAPSRSHSSCQSIMRTNGEVQSLYSSRGGGAGGGGGGGVGLSPSLSPALRGRPAAGVGVQLGAAAAAAGGSTCVSGGGAAAGALAGAAGSSYDGSPQQQQLQQQQSQVETHRQSASGVRLELHSPLLPWPPARAQQRQPLLLPQQPQRYQTQLPPPSLQQQQQQQQLRHQNSSPLVETPCQPHAAISGLAANLQAKSFTVDRAGYFPHPFSTAVAAANAAAAGGLPSLATAQPPWSNASSPAAWVTELPDPLGGTSAAASSSVATSRTPSFAVRFRALNFLPAAASPTAASGSGSGTPPVGSARSSRGLHLLYGRRTLGLCPATSPGSNGGGGGAYRASTPQSFLAVTSAGPPVRATSVTAVARAGASGAVQMTTGGGGGGGDGTVAMANTFSDLQIISSTSPLEGASGGSFPLTTSHHLTSIQLSSMEHQQPTLTAAVPASVATAAVASEQQHQQHPPASTATLVAATHAAAAEGTAPAAVTNASVAASGKSVSNKSGGGGPLQVVRMAEYYQVAFKIVNALGQVASSYIRGAEGGAAGAANAAANAAADPADGGGNRELRDPSGRVSLQGGAVIASTASPNDASASGAAGSAAGGGGDGGITAGGLLVVASRGTE